MSAEDEARRRAKYKDAAKGAAAFVGGFVGGAALLSVGMDPSPVADLFKSSAELAEAHEKKKAARAQAGRPAQEQPQYYCNSCEKNIDYSSGGLRYHCVSCADYDLCQACHVRVCVEDPQQKEHPGHLFQVCYDVDVEWYCDGCRKDLTSHARHHCRRCAVSYDLCYECCCKREQLHDPTHANDFKLMFSQYPHFCNVCEKSIAVDTKRFQCLDCQDWDCCENCWNAGKSHTQHQQVMHWPNGAMQALK